MVEEFAIMLLSYIKKPKKSFKIRVKFSSKSEEEKEKLLFQVFDLLLSNKKKTKPKKKQDFKGYPMFFLTKDMVDKFFSIALNSTEPANK